MAFRLRQAEEHQVQHVLRPHGNTEPICWKKLGSFICLNVKSAGIHLTPAKCPDGYPCDRPDLHHEFQPENKKKS